MSISRLGERLKRAGFSCVVWHQYESKIFNGFEHERYYDIQYYGTIEERHTSPKPPTKKFLKLLRKSFDVSISHPGGRWPLLICRRKKIEKN